MMILDSDTNKLFIGFLNKALTLLTLILQSENGKVFIDKNLQNNAIVF